MAASPEALDHAMRRAIAVARSARAHGNHPFGAVLLDGDGRIVLEAENTVVTHRDATGHAETNLVRLASNQLDADELGVATLVTSTEPCAMCTGAIYWAGIGAVPYGLPETALYAMTGAHPENPTLLLPCRDVFAAGSRTVSVTGPLLEELAREPHVGFWD